MSYTQAQLDALKEAAAKGVRSVSYDGNTVQYASLAEIRTQIQFIERALAPRRRTHYPAFDRGT